MAEGKIKVGIIILNYNGYTDTIECLESLKNADFLDRKVSVFVIDNGSTNESVNEISQWMKKNVSEYLILSEEKKVSSPFILYAGTENLGFSGGNNIGIRLAQVSGMDYVLLLNNDTVVEPGFLEPLLKIADDDSSVGIVGAKIVDYYHRNHYILGGYVDLKKCSGYHFYDTEQANHTDITFTSGCIWLIPIQVFKKCGLMDPNYFLYVEDVDFCYEVIMHGYHITCTKDSVIYHKEGKSTEIKPTMTYYNTRNRLYFAHKMKEPFRRKILFYLYFGFTRIIKALLKPSIIPYVKKGIVDYRRKYYGKYE